MSLTALIKELSLSLVIALSVTQTAQASPQVAEAPTLTAPATAAWRTAQKDNICGLTNPRQLTQPARVDYRIVLAATPEMKDLERRGIAPNSAEGQILRQRAVDRVRRVGSKLMRRSGHCSLWKRISHRDGRQVPDLTSTLIASLNAA